MEFSTSNYLIENGENEKDFSIIDFFFQLFSKKTLSEYKVPAFIHKGKRY